MWKKMNAPPLTQNPAYFIPSSSPSPPPPYPPSCRGSPVMFPSPSPPSQGPAIMFQAPAPPPLQGPPVMFSSPSPPSQGPRVMLPPVPPPSQGPPVMRPWQWPPVEELKKAAIKGNVNFLKYCITSNIPVHYYFTMFPGSQPQPRNHGNILHLAVIENREDFIRVVIQMLPLDAVQHLLLQPRSPDNMSNPLHTAASLGNLEIVKLFLKVFQSSSQPSGGKPWLANDSKGMTPCHLAVKKGQQNCASEIFKMDVELLSNRVDHVGNGLLYLAVQNTLHDFALEILNSASSFSCSGSNGQNPLHIITRCQGGEDICRKLLEKRPNLVEEKSEKGWSILHFWAERGDVWPFKCLLRSNDIIPDIRAILVNLMIATEEENGRNPLHFLAAVAPYQEYAIQIAKLLIETYQNERSAQQPSSISSENLPIPWLKKDREEKTPLLLSLGRAYPKLAAYILSVDYNAIKECEGITLSLAIDQGCLEVAEKILDIVEKQKWTTLTNDQQVNALHLAPKCTDGFFRRLLIGNPKLLEITDKQGRTVVHHWVSVGKAWPFEELMKMQEIDEKSRSHFINLISAVDKSDLNNPFHFAALHCNKETVEIVNILVSAYKQKTGQSDPNLLEMPWFVKNKNNDGPLHLALDNRHAALAERILSLWEDNACDSLLDYYDPQHKTLFLAIEKNCYQVAKNIMGKLQEPSTYLSNSSDQNILHLAPSCTDKEFGKWLVEKAPLEFISKKDKSGRTPLDEASDVGANWIVPTMLRRNPLGYSSVPCAWVKACEKGHVSTIRAFMEYNPEDFVKHCHKIKDSPLHHIRGLNASEYEEFLKIPHVKDLIDVKDSNGETPLHRAIHTENISLTETLLKIENIPCDNPNYGGETPRGLLEVLYKENQDWKLMCKKIKFNPSIKMAYFQRSTNLLEVRNTLSVVAALVATITFTAGFTLPGGLNQDTGEAMLAKKAAFMVFLISDTLAMCSSMLVLICLIWSMVYEIDKSLLLIDRSMILLMLSLYSTLSTFMSGVFLVISQKSLWTAILIIVVCSLLGIASSRTLLYRLLKLSPSANRDHWDRFRLLELGGKVCFCRGGCSFLKCD